MTGEERFKAALRRHRRAALPLKRRLPRLTQAQTYKLLALIIAAIAAAFLESNTLTTLLDVFLK